MAESRVTVRRRFWFEAVLAAVTGVLFVVTLFWHEWLEAFGFDPDHGDGSAEWLIVGVLLLICVASSAVARIEWRRTAIDSV
ncbi:hypothetical protein EV645_6482 [Kribbella rubisoli]|uniref:Uncharacterized protein n=1 Tax=Kribbella rubisoli TaxID=3075929 RepID=A0A4Q7WMR4_9ACTN|nr:ABC transporter permease [Kribbella rubisoli]RZU11320.1 hypothetical protein EV645_6482 [Kribbella rubisoli]